PAGSQPRGYHGGGDQNRERDEPADEMIGPRRPGRRLEEVVVGEVQGDDPRAGTEQRDVEPRDRNAREDTAAFVKGRGRRGGHLSQRLNDGRRAKGGRLAARGPVFLCFFSLSEVVRRIVV